MIRERAGPPQRIALDHTGIPNPPREFRRILMERLKQEISVCAKNFFVGFEDGLQESRRQRLPRAGTGPFRHLEGRSPESPSFDVAFGHELQLFVKGFDRKSVAEGKR